MENNLYCSLIHHGLELHFKKEVPTAQHCCLRHSGFPIDVTQNFWHDPRFVSLRNFNKQNKWDPKCNNCKYLEKSGNQSFRTGMNSNFGIGEYDSTGPKIIDLLFDISCNLACRTCGPDSSTMWKKHLKEHSLFDENAGHSRSVAEVISALQNLDLSNLKMLVFCGGETLLGHAHWAVAEWLADHVPNAKQQLTLCFQTNGTQPIPKKNYKLIDRFHLVKLHISLDGVGKRFDYLRWPADWNQVVENIQHLRETAPSNVMFLIEETVSIFNLYYQNELATWVKNNFATNREGDVVNHSRHLAHGFASLDNCSQQYVDHVQGTPSADLIPADWKENLLGIQEMLAEIRKFDQIRGESFETTFPEVAAFY